MAAPKRFPQDFDEIEEDLADGDYILVVNVSDTTQSDDGSLALATMADVATFVAAPTGTWTDAAPTVVTGDDIVSAATFAGGRYVKNGDVVTCSGQVDVTATGAGAVLVLVAAPVAFEISSPPTGRGGAPVADVLAVFAGNQPIVGFVGPYPVGATTTGAIAVVFVSTATESTDYSFPFTMQYGVTS